MRMKKKILFYKLLTLVPLYFVFYFQDHNSLSEWQNSATYVGRLMQRPCAEDEGSRGKIQGCSEICKI